MPTNQPTDNTSQLIHLYKSLVIGIKQLMTMNEVKGMFYHLQTKSKKKISVNVKENEHFLAKICQQTNQLIMDMSRHVSI